MVCLKGIPVHQNWLNHNYFVRCMVSTHFDISNLKNSSVSLSGTEARWPPLIWHSLSASQNDTDTLLLQKHLPSNANKESGHCSSIVPFDSAKNGMYFCDNQLVKDISLIFFSQFYIENRSVEKWMIYINNTIIWYI